MGRADAAPAARAGRASSASRPSRPTTRARTSSSGAARIRRYKGAIPRINPAILLDTLQARSASSSGSRGPCPLEAPWTAPRRPRARRPDVPHVAAAHAPDARARARSSRSAARRCGRPSPPTSRCCTSSSTSTRPAAFDDAHRHRGRRAGARASSAARSASRCGMAEELGDRVVLVDAGAARSSADDGRRDGRRRPRARRAIVALPPTLTAADRLRPAAARLPRPARPADAAGHGVEVHGGLRRAVLARATG